MDVTPGGGRLWATESNTSDNTSTGLNMILQDQSTPTPTSLYRLRQVNYPKLKINNLVAKRLFFRILQASDKRTFEIEQCHVNPKLSDNTKIDQLSSVYISSYLTHPVSASTLRHTNWTPCMWLLPGTAWARLVSVTNVAAVPALVTHAHSDSWSAHSNSDAREIISRNVVLWQYMFNTLFYASRYLTQMGWDIFCAWQMTNDTNI